MQPSQTYTQRPTKSSAETDCEIGIVRVERRLDEVFVECREEAQGRAENAAQRAAGHESRGQNDAALANAAAVLAAGFLRAR